MGVGYLELIETDLYSVNQKIENAFKTKPGPLTNFAHLDFEALQKHLHPALVLLSGQLFKYAGEKLVSLASVIQFIYFASSVHFRIPDDYDRFAGDGDLRDGSRYPVLAGLYLYGKYFAELCEAQMLEFLSPLSTIVAEMNYGALLRKKNAGQPENDMRMAMTIIEKESALLMEGATRFAGLLAQADPYEVNKLALYGRNIGMAYGILERNLDPQLAEPYFQAAIQALYELPQGNARDGLESLVNQLQSGKLLVPPKKMGRSQDLQHVSEIAATEKYKDREEYIHSIFSAIADKYDSINTVLSLNQDKYWRKFTVEQTGLKPGGSVLDVCCGTGMISLELAKKVRPNGQVVGLDFCQEMLDVAEKALAGTPYADNVRYMQGNVMALPFPDNMFDAVTVGFGLRNIPNFKIAIREMTRVVKPGGRVVCLEFGKPTVPVFKQIYNLYFGKFVPLLGKIGVGADSPYKYLHSSWKAFPHQKELRDEFTRQGLQEATFYELTGGVVAVHIGVKPVPEHASSVAAAKE